MCERCWEIYQYIVHRQNFYDYENILNRYQTKYKLHKDLFQNYSKNILIKLQS